MKYMRVSAVPTDLRWCTPPQGQGQMIEVSYAAPGSHSEECDGAPYRRVWDHGIGPEAKFYYRRIDT